VKESLVRLSGSAGVSVHSHVEVGFAGASGVAARVHMYCVRAEAVRHEEYGEGRRGEWDDLDQSVQK
jgi:hypothetical protein